MDINSSTQSTLKGMMEVLFDSEGNLVGIHGRAERDDQTSSSTGKVLPQEQIWQFQFLLPVISEWRKKGGDKSNNC